MGKAVMIWLWWDDNDFISFVNLLDWVLLYIYKFFMNIIVTDSRFFAYSGMLKTSDASVNFFMSKFYFPVNKFRLKFN